MERPPIVLDRDVIYADSEDFLERRPELPVFEDGDPVDLLAAQPSPTALLTSNGAWKDEYLAALNAGDWVSTTGAGYDEFPLDAFEELGVAFSHMPGNNAAQVAEHAFAMALSYTRRLWTFRDQQQAGEWRRVRRGVTHLTGDVCCVVGLGHVGEAVAERARAFGMTVRGVKRTTDGYEGVADAVFEPASLHDALSDARLVVVSVPLTDETRSMIGTAEIDEMADGAILVNVARGQILDADAVLAALEAGSLRAACLDVTDPEPLPADSPLWERRDVLITAHSASQSDKRPGQIVDGFLAQYDRWCRGEALRDRLV